MAVKNSTARRRWRASGPTNWRAVIAECKSGFEESFGIEWARAFRHIARYDVAARERRETAAALRGFTTAVQTLLAIDQRKEKSAAADQDNAEVKRIIAALRKAKLLNPSARAPDRRSNRALLAIHMHAIFGIAVTARSLAYASLLLLDEAKESTPKAASVAEVIALEADRMGKAASRHLRHRHLSGY